MKPIYLFILTLFGGLVCMYTTPVLFGVGMHSQQIYIFTLAMLVYVCGSADVSLSPLLT